MLFTARLTANAEVRTVKGDKKVTHFSVAINQRYKTKSGEKKEKVAYVDCSYWINPGLAEYLTKGSVVEISGWVEAQAYESKTKGLQASLTCNCDTIKLFSARGFITAGEEADAAGDTPADNKQMVAVPAGTAPGEDDNAPF